MNTTARAIHIRYYYLLLHLIIYYLLLFIIYYLLFIIYYCTLLFIIYYLLLHLIIHYYLLFIIYYCTLKHFGSAQKKKKINSTTIFSPLINETQINLFKVTPLITE